jgi:hypothetical protein
MGVQVYRKGNTHTVRGVQCELTVTDGDIAGYLADGWVLDEKELVEVEEDSPSKVGSDTAAAEERAKAQKEREDEFDLELLRSDARYEGIKNVGNKSAATLKKELDELKEE